ncbi:membrane protein [Paenibacillus sp. FSL R5-0912]|nr:membrane protein [Paenibacillus sp. FSL R5-0912]
MIRALVLILAFSIAAYAIVQYGVLKASDAGLVSFKLQKPNFELKPWIYVLYIHIFTAIFALIIGPFQLFMKPTNDRKRWHRLLGYGYVLSITVSGIVSVYLSLFATGGWIAGLGFMSLDVLWVATTLTATRKIMAKDIQAHKAWMLRSYALTFAAVTLRIWLAPLTLLFGDFEAGFRVVAWVCWIPNLLVIEAVIFRMRLRQRQ